MTDKQKAMIDLYFSGNFYGYFVDAHIEIYGMKNSTRKTHTESACRIMKRPDTKAYYKKLKNEQFIKMFSKNEDRRLAIIPNFS